MVEGSAGIAGGLEALGNAAGAVGEGVNWMLEDSVVKEHRQRALPYTSALEDASYDAPMREEEEPERPARKRKVAMAIEGGSSSSSSSSTAIAVPSYGATTGKLKNPLRITREDVEGVIDKLSGVRDFGFGAGGLGY